MPRLTAVLVALVVTAGSAEAQFASEMDRREALQHYQIGRQLMSAEQFEQAAEAFQRSIDKDPLLTAAHYGLGGAYMELRRYASAIRAFTNCREAHRTLHGLAQRGRIDLERQREDEIRELRETIRRLQGMPLRIRQLEARIHELERERTSNTGAFEPPAALSLALGSAYFRNGRFEEAEGEWRAATEADPNMGEAFNNLAALYAMTGRKRDAEGAVRSAEGAGFPVHPQLREDIRNLPDNPDQPSPR